MVMSVMWFLLSCHGAAVQLLQAGHQIDGCRSGLHLLECVLVHVLAHGVDADHTLHVLLRQTIHGGVQGIALACHTKHSFLWVAPTTAPIRAVSTFAGGHHQLEMKKLEYEHQEREAQQKREREIYEGYIRAAGAAIQYQTKESIQTFGEHSALAMYYVPEELRADMVLLEKLAQRRESYDDLLVRKVELLNRIIVKMRELRGAQSSTHQQ